MEADPAQERKQSQDMGNPNVRRSSIAGGARNSFVLHELQRRRRLSLAPTNLLGIDTQRRQNIIPVVPRDTVLKKLQAINDELKIKLDDGDNLSKQDSWKSEFHEVMYRFTETKIFSGFILFIILLNTAMLIAQTWQEVSVRAGWYFTTMDNVFLGVYIMEIVLKLYVWRTRFFTEGWNVLDFTIVVFNVVDFSLPLVIANVGGFNGAAIFRLLRIFKAFRAIRALRVLRTIRFLSNLQVIMTTLLQSIRSIGTIVMLISLVMYMFAVIGRGLYAEVDPENFGSLFHASFTLFQLLTLDDWFDIYTKVSSSGRWHIILYLLIYILLEYFIFLNLFVAVLVDNFQLTLEAQNEAQKKKKKSAEDSDDEEDYFLAASIDSGSTNSAFSDDTKHRKTLEEHYPDISESEYTSLSRYLQLLAALEHTSHIMNNQQRVLNMMVDMCVETNDDI